MDKSTHYQVTLVYFNARNTIAVLQPYMNSNTHNIDIKWTYKDQIVSEYKSNRWCSIKNVFVSIQYADRNFLIPILASLQYTSDNRVNITVDIT